MQRSQPYAWKIFHSTESDEIPGDFYSHRYPFCDVFVMLEVRCQFVRRSKCGPARSTAAPRWRADSTASSGWPTCSCLAATYGPGWASVGATHFFCHKSAGLLRQETWQLEAGQLGPALPIP